MDGSAAALRSAMTDFDRYMAAERGFSAHTATAYRRDVEDLLAFLGDEPMTTALIRAWLAQARERGVGSATVARRIASLRCFAHWAVRQGLLDADPTLRLRSPRVVSDLPRVADSDRLNEALDTLNRVADDPIAVRDVAALELLYGSGLRVSEVCSIDVGDIDHERRTVRVLGKGAKQRVVPLTVSGAFHTPLMQTAADGMRQVLAGVAFSAPVMPVVSNVTAQPITEGSVLAEELASQITSPVLWADSVATMAAAGVTEVIEFGPGKVLTGLVKRIDRSIACRNVGTAEEASA